MKESRVQYYIPEKIDGLELLSCSDTSYHFTPHFHDSYCIWLSARGAEAYTHKGNTGLLSVGEIGIIAPGEVHSNNTAFAADSRQLLTFYLDDSSLRKISADILDGLDFSTEIRTDFHTDKELFTELFSLWQILRRSNSTLELQTSLYSTLALLINRYATSPYRETPVSHEKERVAKIIELFHQHLGDDMRLDELARQVDCTSYHLIRFFKKAVGLTPHAYLIQLRLEKARSLLRRGVSVVDASFSSGFTDQSHLTRHFKQKFGVTPGNYKQQVLNS